MADTTANSTSSSPSSKATTRRRTSTAKKTDSAKKEQVTQSQNTAPVEEPQYYATRRNHFGVQLLDIGPIGWVGPVPLSVPVDRVPVLIKTLQAAIKLDEPQGLDAEATGVEAPAPDGTTKPKNSNEEPNTVTTAD